MKSIYLVRHTSVYNPTKLCFGQSEIPLEENFTVSFDWIKEQLNTTENCAFYSSPLRRCTKLASYLSDDNFTIESRLNDLNFGNWEMKGWDKIPAKEVKLWQDDFVNYSTKKGENFADLFERSVAFYEEVCSTTNKENIVIICHAGNIRSILSYVLDFPLENVFNLKIDYGSISKIAYNEAQKLSTIELINFAPNSFKNLVKD
ncbi:histidine phosphatase family protein [Pedobacter alpinus]|uniref:Histidine phosphatase family protein n=1 Tax=Pedobacter alpinus TaxID=1590643 RepID=A0ABW5TRT6_9SPHI